MPSKPVLIARTGIPWKEPTGPEAYPIRKELRPIGNHEVKAIWEDKLAPELHQLLDSMEVKWTSTEIIRIGAAEEAYAPVILWIGVIPSSLSGDPAVHVASECQNLLAKYNIKDIDVEIRGSTVTRSAGPKLLEHVSAFDPTVDVRIPLTATLGHPICAQHTPEVEGTGGFFITKDEDTKRVFLVTARHVLFPPEKNTHFEYENNQPRHNITLFSDNGFEKHLKSIKDEIRSQRRTKDYNYRVRCDKKKDDAEAKEIKDFAQDNMDRAEKAEKRLEEFHEDILTSWGTQESRLIGHTILSPPISISKSEGYTEDWAIIEIDPSKVDESNFHGNAIDLGTKIEDLLSKFPDYFFEYLCDHLLRLKGTMISDREMRHPTILDPCLIVLKNGNATGLTVGRANDIFSYTQIWDENGKATISKEWAILPFDSKSGAFSAKGDSGAVIVDSRGRIGGLITSGAGSTSGLDITYATPIGFLFKSIEENGFQNPNVNIPDLTEWALPPNKLPKHPSYSSQS